MVDADSLDSHCHLSDAYAADISQRFVSNGSSEQHDAVQMLVLDASDHRPLQRRQRRVSINWLLADAPHVVGLDVSVDVSCSAIASAWTCRVNATTVVVVVGLLHKNCCADNCSLTSPDGCCADVLVTWSLARACSLVPFRSKKFCCVTSGGGGCWRSLRWAYEVVSASATLTVAALA